MDKLDFTMLSSLRNNEHYQFLSDFNSLIEKATASELGITLYYDAFLKAFNIEGKAIRAELGSSKSKTIEDLDIFRDKTWNAIKQRVNSNLLSPLDNEVASAIMIKRVLDLYGDFRKNPYNEESAKITNLVNDLQSAANLPHLVVLGIIAWVDALKCENEEFQVVFNDRNAELSARFSGDVRAARKNTDPQFKLIYDIINASIVLNQAKPATETFVKELNEKVSYYKNTITTRMARNNNETKKNL